MRVRLPLHLVQSILLLSLTIAADVGAPTGDVETAVTETQCPAPVSTSAPQLTLWDIGLAIQREWEASREGVVLSEEETECPVPPRPDKPDRDIPVETELSRQGKGEQNEPDDFVSFEDWKRKRLAEEEASQELDDQTESRKDNDPDARQLRQEDGAQNGSNDSGSTHSRNNDDSAHSDHESPKSEKNQSAEDNKAARPSAHAPQSTQGNQQHVNRYNYASPDCSARIHSSSPQTQHASSLLHKSRDRYMLTPCKAAQHWVVVELCDEIRIEALEIAVWEFFSGVVREVRVSVGGEDEGEEVDGGSKEWKEVGAFIGKNVRGIQTFTLPLATSFHRFLRLDFPTFYGSEYYCPVSHLKVFGMNQMEAFKWEQKRLAASAKDREKEREKEKASARDADAEVVRAREKDEQAKRRDEEAHREKELAELEKLVLQEARRAPAQSATSKRTEASSRHAANVTAISARPSNGSTNGSLSAEVDNLSAPANGSLTESPVTTSLPLRLAAENDTSSTVSSSSTTKVPALRSDSSESIYVLITRRLNALEGNSSLIARYIEEQSRLVRSVLGRVEKDWDKWRIEREVGERSRWEQERMRQEDRLGKILSQLEQQRLTLEADRLSMASQLRILSDELSYERRRGLAQLAIMIVLIGLGVVSRSSAIDAVLKPLVAEARRRRSIYGKERKHGPLTGLRIDMGLNRPARVIGQTPEIVQNGFDPVKTPSSPDEMNVEWAAEPVSPTPRLKSVNGSIRSGTPTRRPGTPNGHTHLRNRRHPSLLTANFRSFSTSNDMVALRSPRDGRSLPVSRQAGAGSHRRLARSAHLHTIEADRVREKVRSDNPTASEIIQRDFIAISPKSIETTERLEEQTAWSDNDSNAGSGTDVENDLIRKSLEKGRTDSLTEELKAIWDQKTVE